MKITDFSLKETVECGQCFRYEKLTENQYKIIASNKVIIISQNQDTLSFSNNTNLDFWKHYLHLDGDYAHIKKTLSQNDSIMQEAISFASGIHLLRQDFFETLISFIISQNNHIPRIRRLIQLLCEAYGEDLENNNYAFPSPNALKNVTEAEYRAMGFGFRGRYLVDAVSKVNTTDFSPNTLSNLPTLELRKKLMSIVGVGEKVADCILLFACGRYEVFPVDVWVNRIYSHLYANDEKISLKELHNQASTRFSSFAGFAQQYLFYYTRKLKIGK